MSPSLVLNEHRTTRSNVRPTAPDPRTPEQIDADWAAYEALFGDPYEHPRQRA